MAQLATTHANNREQLITQQQKLLGQFKTLQFQIFDKTSPDVVEHISQLQLKKAKQKGILQQAQQQLAQLNPELESFDAGAEQILLEAISQQHWYGFKNKRELVFDSRTGMLFPNFEYVPHIKVEDWKKSKKTFSLNGIHGDWQILSDKFYYDEGVCKTFYGNWELSNHQINNKNIFTYPLKFSGKNKVSIYYSKYINANGTIYRTYYSDNFCDVGLINRQETNGDLNRSTHVFPVLTILDSSDLSPDYPRLTAQEKAKIILEFFIQKDWIPNFEPFLTQNIGEDKDDFDERFAEAQKQCDEYNRIFDAYYQWLQLQKQLVSLEQQIAELPEPEPENQFTSDFDYRQEIQNYNLTDINTSVWQYSLSAQQWVNYLLTQIDTWENNHQHLLENALELITTLAKKLPISLNLNDAEQELLNYRHLTLQQRLNFSLEPLRSALIDLLQQNQKIEVTLQNTHALTALAELEQQPRPSFILLAEHTAMLCTQTLKKLEWLESSLDFVNAIVKSEQQNTEDYLILLDKYQQDLVQIGLDASIESEDVEKWFVEWRLERLQILQQWQPLIQAGLNGVISEQTVLNTLQCLAQYQQNLDKFYLEKRLGIHTTYAFVPNGHRQEKLEKEQEFTKLIHQFMQNLEKVIFASQNTAQKIWLVRFSEVWQQGVVQEIIAFLANEELLDRSDIAQIISEEMRKIQQQSLAACLQDANSYSQALAQRDKDFGTLMFKMRKALQK